MTRRLLIGLPFLAWLVCGVILMTSLHVLPPWAWLLTLAPAAAMSGVLATWLDRPQERYLRRLRQNRREATLSRCLPSSPSSALPPSVKSRP